MRTLAPGDVAAVKPIEMRARLPPLPPLSVGGSIEVACGSNAAPRHLLGARARAHTLSHHNVFGGSAGRADRARARSPPYAVGSISAAMRARALARVALVSAWHVHSSLARSSSFIIASRRRARAHVPPNDFKQPHRLANAANWRLISVDARAKICAPTRIPLHAAFARARRRTFHRSLAKRARATPRFCLEPLATADNRRN